MLGLFGLDAHIILAFFNQPTVRGRETHEFCKLILITFSLTFH